MILLLPFIALAILIIVTPGPDIALVTRNALKDGRRSGLVTSLGIATGLLVWTGASALGVGALLEANAFAFTFLRFAGAGYLSYLGIRALLSIRHKGGFISTKKDKENYEDDRRKRSTNPLSLVGHVNSPYIQGLLNDVLNPKVAILFTSLIPQFIILGSVVDSSNLILGSLELAGIFTLMGLGWLTFLSFAISKAQRVLNLPRVKRSIDAATGASLVALGIRVATETQ